MDNEYKFDLQLRDLINRDTTQLPEVVKTRINDTLASLPSYQSFKPVKYIAAVAILMLGLTFGLGLVSPAVAQVLKFVPIIGYVFETAGDSGLQDALKQGHVTPINQTVSNHGIKFTVTDGVFDGARLSIGYTQESLFGPLQIERPNIWVNGNKINFSAGYAGKLISPTKYAGVISIDPTVELPDKFDIRITIDAIGFVPGNWEYNFPVSIGKSRLVLNPGLIKTYDDIQMNVKKVTLAPSATNFKIEMNWPHKYFSDFRLFDDNGRMLQNFSLAGAGNGSSQNGRETITYSASFAPVQNQPKYLILRPIINKWGENNNLSPSENTEAELTQKQPITLSQGKVGSLTITSVEYFHDKTRVHYEVSGSDPYNQAWVLWLQDENGKKYDINSPKSSAPKRESDIKYAFFRDFPPVEQGEKIHAVTRQFDGPVYTDELEFKIPLQWQ